MNLREISLNGYIDDEVWFGDEITPETLHESLYGTPDMPFSDDVHIRLNSYGGSCNAATRMFDDIRAYPGNVHITVSGTAASAATVLSMAANKLEMTPGSLWMIHDPSTVAWGDERDLQSAIDLLRACKESILNVYAKRCKQKRNDVAAMMTATTWLDAKSALEYGFIDGITEDEPSATPTNSAAPRKVDITEAKAKVQVWFDRHTPHNPQLSRPKSAVESAEVIPDSENSTSQPTASAPPGDDHTSTVSPANEQVMRPETEGGTAPPAMTQTTDESPTEPENLTPSRDTPANEAPAEDDPFADAAKQPEITGTPVAQLRKRLGLIMPAKRSF